jgi:hypothetical protein
MGDPETVPEDLPAPEAELVPAIPGVSIGERKPDAIADPITDPDIPELQDRRRPLP